jgi:aminomethyltransferase
VFLPDGADSAGSVAQVGYVTSGTMVPYWKVQGEGLASRFGDEKGMRAIGLALLRSDLVEGTALQVEIRGKRSPAAIVQCHLRGEAPPFAWPRLVAQPFQAVQATRPRDAQAGKPVPPVANAPTSSHTTVSDLLRGAIGNTVWRQRECINLIPSEMTQSPMVRLLSVMDPSFRYAEHKQVKALRDAEIFYYQGTGFIEEVERLVEEQFRLYLGCSDVEARPVSGQMANTVVYSAMVDYLNRANRRDEPRRISRVMNNGIFCGGHLSAQPMGALKDYVARDPQSESPAVVNFPVRKDNPYKMDVEATRELIARYRPELIILGRSLVLYPEPVAQIRAAVDELKLDTLVMYDMAHVLGLVGPHFQEPFKEGADVVTGSTHKTFFGTQRGVVAASIGDNLLRRELWDAIRRRTFPGSVSNHHLGTMLGLLMAAYEMNHFKDQYQPAVIANAKAFAAALHRCGLELAGDPADSYTQTHQVVVVVGYGKGPELAKRLEESNIIVNYQAGPQTEGFSAAEAIRMGASEMTRWGMREADFGQLAQLISDVVKKGRNVAQEVKTLRSRFTDLQYCFGGEEFEQQIQALHKLI